MGIKKENVFVDFISQNKIYNHQIDENSRIVTQKTVGFEIKKNIIIEINDYSQIEKIISEASEYQIFDIIKVDYINTDIEKIKQKLIDEAYQILNKKKDDYQKKFDLSYIGDPKGSENFSFVFPKSQYKKYTAFESSEVENPYYENNNYIKKEERKSTTFYYEGLEYSGFDRIINSENPTIGIQYVMNLSVTYDIKRGK